MKIKIIKALTGVTRETIEAEKATLRKYASPGTEFDIEAIKKGAETIESHFDEYLGAVDTFRLVKKAEQEGFDGVIITCFANANVDPSREIATIPVIGSGMAAMSVASLLGHGFSLITTSKAALYRHYHEAMKLGLAGKLVSIQRCDATVSDLIADRKNAVSSFLEAANRAIDDGADVIVPACFGMAGLAEELQAHLPVPVVDPAGAAIGIMETLVRLGLSQSKLAYPVPPKKKRSWGL